MIATQFVLPQPTVVTFPAGSLREIAAVLQVAPDPRTAGRLLVITDVTPFHPLDPLWPDQPADHGELRCDDQIHAIVDTVTVCLRDNGPIMVDAEIDARRNEPGTVFMVAHVIDAAAVVPAPGTTVALAVDEARRLRLSAAHTGCHLLAYALNEATHHLWKKPAQADSRGHHDFDAATCVLTRHNLAGSHDDYRLGKSLRKRGFRRGAFPGRASRAHRRGQPHAGEVDRARRRGPDRLRGNPAHRPADLDV